MSSFTQLRGTSEDGRMASMLQEGPDGEHVRGQADPGGKTPPCCAPPDGAPALAYGPGEGAPRH